MKKEKEIWEHTSEEVKEAREQLKAMYNMDDWTGEEIATHIRYGKESGTAKRAGSQLASF